MEEAIAFLAGLPPLPVYALLAAGAAIENVLPVVPADTFIVAGGFLGGLGTVSARAAFAVVWLFNVAGATGVYLAGFRYGSGFFRKGSGRRFLSSDQLARLEKFYDRWGVAAIFAARFLPGYRALVPVFAGVAKQPLRRVLPPVLIASAVWYGALVWAGFSAGQNLDAVVAAIRRTNKGLLAVALLLAVPLAAWGWKHRRRGARARAEAGTAETDRGS